MSVELKTIYPQEKIFFNIQTILLNIFFFKKIDLYEFKKEYEIEINQEFLHKLPFKSYTKYGLNTDNNFFTKIYINRKLKSCASISTTIYLTNKPLSIDNFYIKTENIDEYVNSNDLKTAVCNIATVAEQEYIVTLEHHEKIDIHRLYLLEKNQLNTNNIDQKNDLINWVNNLRII